jgi:outer membrane scaffolding protein for murein synthesis (MipA/OmpV family)
MKKLLLSLTLVFSAGVAQNLNAQAVEQGNMTFDVYYGFPNLTGSLAKSISTDSELTVKSLGPIGGKFEYMVSDKMGVGLETNYSSTTVTYTEFDSFDSTNYEYNWSITSIRFMPRWNIHFGSSDNFDGYFGIAAGYLARTYKDSSTDPNYTSTSISGAFPFALRLAVGGRYYFTDNIGLHMELGFGGGALIHGGFAFKF